MFDSVASVESLVTPQCDDIESPITQKLKYSPIFPPNNYKYYNDHLNKSQFNLILINSSINLLKILYPNCDIDKLNLKFFIIEILRRSKTSIQSLQICGYYIFKIIQNQAQENFKQEDLPDCPKKLFLGLVILASKFNQDHNYSFKSWLKICGCKNESDDKDLNLQNLRKIEINCLNLLNYQLYLNGLKYENWCNILIIFGYDFIKFHKINNELNVNELNWESDDLKINLKLIKWFKFLINMNEANLKSVRINFVDYYNNQLGKKVLVNYQDLSSSKRCFEDDNVSDNKKVKSVFVNN